MSVLKVTPKFLYPHSRQFLFDEVTEKIVRAIEKRNWNVPGVTIEFDTYGSGEAKYQMIRRITGDYFELYFCRIQGKLDAPWNDMAALQSVCIPKQILKVYEDESGPVYYLYVGNDWDADKEWFMNSTKVHSKLEKEPRRYLRYEGNTYQRRAKELIADNDLGREYSPEGDEPVRINFEEKLNEITKWLEEHVLGYILSFPEAETICEPTPTPELIPYNGPWDTVYSVCEWQDAERIEIGKENPSKLRPGERHAYFGSGHRLVSLDVPCNERFPKIAYEGFIWCDVNEDEKVTRDEKFTYDVLVAMKPLFGEKYIVAIKLKYANEVYVVDNSKYHEKREKTFKEIAPRKGLTDEELNDAFAARGATIIPITEYKGDYKKPLVLINRELDFDEIEWVKITEK